jgi:hypothetical protein
MHSATIVRMGWRPAKPYWREIIAVACVLLALILWGWMVHGGRYRRVPLGQAHVMVDIRGGNVYRGIRDVKSAFVQRMAQARVDGDNEAFRATLAEWRAYNAARPPERHISVKADDILEKIRTIRQGGAEQRAGISPMLLSKISLIVPLVPLCLVLLLAWLAFPVWLVLTLASKTTYK